MESVCVSPCVSAIGEAVTGSGVGDDMRPRRSEGGGALRPQAHWQAYFPVGGIPVDSGDQSGIQHHA